MNTKIVLAEGAHRTVSFCIDRLMDDDDAAMALRRLGVGIAWPRHDGLPSVSGTGRLWLACGLRSDGVVELWPASDSDQEGFSTADFRGAGISSARLGYLERLLAEAGLPYEIAGAWR